MATTQILPLLLVILCTCSGDNSGDVTEKGDSKVVDWERDNFGRRTSLSRDGLLSRVRVDTDAPKVGNRAKTGRSEFRRSHSHKAPVPRQNNLKVRSRPHTAKLRTPNFKHRSVIRAETIQRASPSFIKISPNFVDLKENIIENEEEPKPTTTTSESSVTKDSSETKLFIPTVRPNDSGEDAVENDEIVTEISAENLGAQTTISSFLSTSGKIEKSDNRFLGDLTISVPSSTHIPEEVDTTVTEQYTDVSHKITDTSNLKPIPKIDDPLVAKKLNRLTVKPSKIMLKTNPNIKKPEYTKRSRIRAGIQRSRTRPNMHAAGNSTIEADKPVNGTHPSQKTDKGIIKQTQGIRNRTRLRRPLVGRYSLKRNKNEHNNNVVRAKVRDSITPIKSMRIKPIKEQENIPSGDQRNLENHINLDEKNDKLRRRAQTSRQRFLAGRRQQHVGNKNRSTSRTQLKLRRIQRPLNESPLKPQEGNDKSRIHPLLENKKENIQQAGVKKIVKPGRRRISQESFTQASASTTTTTEKITISPNAHNIHYTVSDKASDEMHNVEVTTIDMEKEKESVITPETQAEEEKEPENFTIPFTQVDPEESQESDKIPLSQEENGGKQESFKIPNTEVNQEKLEESPKFLDTQFDKEENGESFKIPVAQELKNVVPIPTDMFSQAVHHLMKSKRIPISDQMDLIPTLLPRKVEIKHPKQSESQSHPRNIAVKKIESDTFVPLFEDEDLTEEEKEHEETKKESKTKVTDTSPRKRGRYILAATSNGK